MKNKAKSYYESLSDTEFRFLKEIAWQRKVGIVENCSYFINYITGDYAIPIPEYNRIYHKFIRDDVINWDYSPAKFGNLVLDNFILEDVPKFISPEEFNANKEKEMKFEKLIDRIKICTDQDPASDNERLLYIVEEVGEVATCLAVNSGFKNKVLKESTEEECCDVVITALGLLLRNEDWDSERVLKTISKKLEKWEKRVKND